MNTKQIMLTVLSIFFILPTYSQLKKNNSDYTRFYLSLNGGLNFPLGTSNTVLSEDLTLPFKKILFVPGFDGAWFFTKNYGVGIKYRFSEGRCKEESYSEYKEQTYDEPIYEGVGISFDETNHFIGPAFFAKWSLGESRWMILTNIGVGYLHDKLSKIKHIAIYTLPTNRILTILPGGGYQDSQGNLYPEGFYKEYADLTGTSIGFSVSAGIHYRITSLIGIGINANGLFSSISQMKYQNVFNGKYESIEISRKINRTGLSAAIDFSF